MSYEFKNELKRINRGKEGEKKEFYTYIYFDGAILNNLSNCQFYEFIDFILYIGKGVGTRWKNHAHEAIQQVCCRF